MLHPQRFYKKAAAFVLRAVAKHSPELAQAVVDCGALDALVISLEEFDPGVKEAAAWALGYIARHNGCKSEDFKTTHQLLPQKVWEVFFLHVYRRFYGEQKTLTL